MNDDTCETHAWASIGTVTREGTVYRIWECEQCSVWSAEPFDPANERAWDDTWLADR